jgi:hypothetical protein
MATPHDEIGRGHEWSRGAYYNNWEGTCGRNNIELILWFINVKHLNKR